MIFTIFCSLLLNVFFTVLAVKKIEPIHTFFYPIAWYTFLVFISGVNFLVAHALSRRTHLSRETISEFSIFNWKNFPKLACTSVFVWLVFELINLQLKNWAYHDVPSNILVLHIFGFLCFSTVLPGIFNIAIFFEHLLRVQPKKIIVNQALLNKFFLLGSISLLLLFTLPKIFFPLAWLCFIFLLEPLNFKC